MREADVRREAAFAAAAYMLRRDFDVVDTRGSLGRSLEVGIAGSAVEPMRRQRLQDDGTILMAGYRVVDGERGSDWADARAARLVRRYDFEPIVDAVEAALLDRGRLSSAEVEVLIASARADIDARAMEEHPLFAAV